MSRGVRRLRDLSVPALLLLGAAALIGAILAGDAWLPDPSPAQVATVDWDIDAGTVHCPVTVAVAEDDEEEPPEEAATISIAAGAEPSAVEVVQDGTVLTAETVEPDSRLTVEVDATAAVDVGWRDAPVAVTWHRADTRTVGGPCIDGAASTVYFAGVNTSLGSSARLHLANPFGIDAVVRVWYGTSDGRRDLVRTDNVAVPSGQTEVLDLVDLQPEQPELGVVVETLAGRVIGQVEVDRVRLDGDASGAQGRTLIEPVTEPAVIWRLAGARENENWTGAVTVFNPSDRQAAVVVRTTDPAADDPAEQILIPAGATERISLADRAEEDRFAVTVESVNDVGVILAGVEANPASGRPGYSVRPGTPVTATSWLYAGLAGDRVEELAVFNPGAEDVTVTVTVDGQPLADWEQQTVEAFSVAFVGDIDAPARVTADGPVVVDAFSAFDEGGDRSHVLFTAFALRDLSVATLPVARTPVLATEPVLPPGSVLDDDDDGRAFRRFDDLGGDDDEAADDDDEDAED